MTIERESMMPGCNSEEGGCDISRNVKQVYMAFDCIGTLFSDNGEVSRDSKRGVCESKKEDMKERLKNFSMIIPAVCLFDECWSWCGMEKWLWIG